MMNTVRRWSALYHLAHSTNIHLTKSLTVIAPLHLGRSVKPIICKPYCIYHGRMTLQPSKDTDVMGEGSLKEDSIHDSVGYFKKLLKDTKNKKANLTPKVNSERLSDLENIRPHPPTESKNFATYTNESEVLTKLLQLKVDLSVVEKEASVVNHLVRANFDTDIRPYIECLHDIGVASEDLGYIFTKNPNLLLEDIDNVQVRFNYLKSKRFSKSAIAEIVTKAPEILTRSTKQTDLHLGFLQKTFKLTGSELRDVISQFPKLSLWPTSQTEEVRFVLKEFLGFTAGEMKQLLMIQPKIFTLNYRAVTEKFNYLHNEMGLSHQDLCGNPEVFIKRLSIFKQRHGFLTKIGRAQYDRTKENFVSVQNLIHGSDSDFCRNVAKVPVQDFNNFLKTI